MLTDVNKNVRRVRPDGVTRDVDLFLGHFRPQNDVGDDFDGGVEAATVDRGRVQERVSGGLAIANAAELFQPTEKNQIKHYAEAAQLFGQVPSDFIEIHFHQKPLGGM